MKTRRGVARNLARRSRPWPLVVLLAACAAEPGAGVPVQARQGDGARASMTVERALMLGRFDEAEALARGAGEHVAGLVRARIAVARGQYEEAEALLAPLAVADPAGDAALELGRLQILLGRQAAADGTLGRILQAARRFTTPSDLARAARAAHALGRLREANALFREAAAGAPDDPAINTAWGDLFLDTYNRPEAVRSFRDALGADGEWVPAHLGLARAVQEENPPAAVEAAQRALRLNPSSVPAHLLVADLALDDGHREEAVEAIGRALEVNARSLEARSLLAAIAYLEDRAEDFEAELERVLAINSRYGDAYRVAAALAARNYRFDEAVTLVRRGLQLDPSSSRAHADLGMHLMRTGDETEARAALEEAFRGDPFDVVTYNLLSLLDTLDEFETIQAGSVVLRLHPEESGVLREYALSLIEEAFDGLSARYGINVEGPILVEIFPRHDDFAVRNLGLPGMIGALGACFGRVITMDSPRARPPGSFHWGATLWHEIAHVITLQMSRQRVPRWLTEGVSVYEEKRARPEWGREMTVPFVQALERGDVLPVHDLNSGFTDPRRISLAYYQASLLVEHLIEAWGEDALHRMLRAYGEGLETEEVIDRVLEVDFDALQAGFDRFLEARFGDLRAALRTPEGLAAPGDGLDALRRAAEAHPGSYAAQLRLGRALGEAGRGREALAPLERAAELVPMVTGASSARALIVEIALEIGDVERAMRELETLLAHDHTGVETARTLARLAEEAGDEARLWTAYTRLVEVDPFDPGAHAALGRLALARGEAGIASREFRAALATGPVDRAAAHSDLAESYLLEGRPADARREAIAALEIAPGYVRAQELLLRAAGEGS